jgi:hypothetical protein
MGEIVRVRKAAQGLPPGAEVEVYSRRADGTVVVLVPNRPSVILFREEYEVVARGNRC